MTTSQSQIRQFVTSQLNLSIATETINKSEWHLIGIGNSSGVVTSYQVSKNNSTACVELILNPETTGIEIQVIQKSKKIDSTDSTGRGITKTISVTPKEVEKPKALLDALERFMTIGWAVQAVAKGLVTYDYVACCYVASQLGLRAMTDRQKLIGFDNATDAQLSRAKDQFLEQFPQFQIAAQETVTVAAIASQPIDQSGKIKISKARNQAVKVV